MRELNVIERGSVLVADGRIAAVGVRIEDPGDAEVIDANGRVLLPGLIDCHTQACWAGDPLASWERRLSGASHREIASSGGGMEAMIAAVKEETRKQLAAGLKPRLEALLREGTTTVEIKSSLARTTEDELKLLHAILRAGNEWPGTIVPTTLLGSGAGGGAEEAVRLAVKEMLPEVAREFPDIAVEAVCEREAWPAEACVRLLEKARKYHPIRVQTDRFASLGLVPEALRLGARCIAGLEAATREDLLRIAQEPVVAVVCPCASFETGRRPARAGFLVESGGAVAVATGCNPDTAPTFSLPFALALAVRGAGLTPAEAITACTVNGAAALGLRDRGTIEPGARADLVLLRHRDERMLAWELGGNPVDAVICSGRRVV